MLRTQSGLVMFRFLKKDEAKALVSLSLIIATRNES